MHILKHDICWLHRTWDPVDPKYPVLENTLYNGRDYNERIFKELRESCLLLPYLPEDGGLRCYHPEYPTSMEANHGLWIPLCRKHAPDEGRALDRIRAWYHGPDDRPFTNDVEHYTRLEASHLQQVKEWYAGTLDAPEE